jgi:hypothetical protein
VGAYVCSGQMKARPGESSRELQTSRLGSSRSSHTRSAWRSSFSSLDGRDVSAVVAGAGVRSVPKVLPLSPWKHRPANCRVSLALVAALGLVEQRTPPPVVKPTEHAVRALGATRRPVRSACTYSLPSRRVAGSRPERPSSNADSRHSCRQISLRSARSGGGSSSDPHPSVCEGLHARSSVLTLKKTSHIWA